MPMDWDKLRVFHAVADAGSLTHAGETLHLSQSAVSRQIRGLEEGVGAPLFHRHARGLLLTEQGEILFEATREMMKQLDSASARIKDVRDDVDGELRVTTTMGFGAMWLSPRLDKMFADYPQLDFHLLLTEEVLDLPMRQADVAIRLKEPNQADLIRRRLFSLKFRFYASHAYLDRMGTPQSAEDLAEHRIIGFSPDAAQVSAGQEWFKPFYQAHKGGKMTVNTYFGLFEAARAGLGVCALPDYLTRGSDDLVNVLPELASEPTAAWFVYPTELRRSRRVAAFRDFVMAELEADGLLAG
ncbi:LysR family transcriptional regulator [Rhodovulum sp. DZ06]|uniref:LysR family transcriptional regulator n=1 Tax=Rhodovulum sp. DZ06 TaxID=3425126 RepID=UPI003D34FE6C